MVHLVGDFELKREDFNSHLLMFLSNDESILEPLLSSFAKVVLPRIQSIEWKCCLVESIMASMLTTPPNIKSLCLDLLLPIFTQLNASQQKRLITLCSEYPPEEKNLEWLYSRYSIIISCLSCLKVADDIPQTVIQSLKTHAIQLKSLSPQYYLKIVSSHPVFINSFNIDAIMKDNSIEYVVSIIKTFNGLSKSTSDAHRLTDMIFKEIVKANEETKFKYIEAILCSSDQDAARVFGCSSNMVTSEDIGYILKRFTLALSIFISAVEENSVWRLQLKLIEKMNSIIYSHFFSSSLYRSIPSTISTSIFHVHLYPFFVFNINQLLTVIPKVSDPVLKQLAVFLSNLYFYAPSDSIQSYFISQIKLLADSKQQSNHRIIIYIFESSKNQPLSDQMIPILDNLITSHPHSSHSLISILNSLNKKQVLSCIAILEKIVLNQHARERYEKIRDAVVEKNDCESQKDNSIESDKEFERIESFRNHFDNAGIYEEERNITKLHPLALKSNKNKRKLLKSSSLNSQSSQNSSNSVVISTSKKNFMRKQTLEEMGHSMVQQVVQAPLPEFKPNNTSILPPKNPSKQILVSLPSCSLSNQKIGHSLNHVPSINNQNTRISTSSTSRNINTKSYSKHFNVKSPSTSIMLQTKKPMFKVTSRKENLAPSNPLTQKTVTQHHSAIS